MALSDADLRTLAKALQSFSGGALDSRRAEMLEARLNQLANARGFQDLTPLFAMLREPLSAHELIEDMLNHETSFFRDTRFFEALRAYVLPAVITKRTPLKRIRILSAGCSTGQEVYSIAMLIRDVFPGLAGWSIEVTGVDVSSKRIARAKEGVFSTHELERGLSAALQQKFFQRDGENFRVSAAIRTLTRFYRLNLAEPWHGLFGYDVVLVRNVLIYLDDVTRSALLSHARHALHSSGMLLLGAAETLDSTKHPFQRTAWGPYSVYLPH
ncbi:MAG: protein-glutamate O-methyltransferase CheR [Clostridia bacterium]|nr:protein-glutamate O-methyltransferase CheR [Deltaproteobacteria bacterium]